MPSQVPHVPRDRPALSAVFSVVGHGLMYLVLQAVGALDTEPEEKRYELTEFELPPPPPEPEPLPEEKPPEPEPDPEGPDPGVKPDPPKDPPPPWRRREVKAAPISDKPVSDEPPPPLRIDQSQVVQDGNSGVGVNTGPPGGVPGGTGKPNSKGTGSRPPGVKTSPTGEPWAPSGELHIKTLPRPLNVPRIQCPAVRELGIEGTVVLSVQVRKSGQIRNVTVAKGIGYGCDKIAAKALRKARFKPAITTNGSPADYELRYEYEFLLDD